MARILLLSVLCLAAVTTVAQTPAPAVTPPQLEAADGSRLVRLARDAMITYLERRTPADQQALPAELKHLEKWNYAASVTLRHEGLQVGRAVSTQIVDAKGATRPGTVCRNVINAALLAMRSDRLPDRVTNAYIEGLTLEVEVLGPPTAIEAPSGRTVLGGDVERLIVPGRTGLLVSRGLDRAYTLPSDGYALGLDAAGLRQAALAAVPLSADNDNLPWRYWLLESRHFVGYGDATVGSAGLVLSLARGKIVLAPEVTASKEMAAEVRQSLVRVTRHLRANQNKDGLYTLGQATTPLRDHLRAACAMLQAGQRLKGQPDVTQEEATQVLASGMKALVYVTDEDMCKRADGRAFLATPEPTEQFAATAMFAYALNLAPRNEKTEKLYGELIKSLLGAIGKDGLPSSRLDGQPTLAKVPLPDAILGYMVLLGAASTPEEVAAYGRMQKALAKAWPATAQEALWRLRAGFEPLKAGEPSRPDPLKTLTQVLPGQGQGDEVGGFSAAPAPAGVELTALALAVLGSGQSWSAVPLEADPAKRARQLESMTRLAQLFAYTMMFHPHEAYFSKDPSAWVGAVRVDAGSARVTPAACAAAIDILLAQPPQAPQAATAPAPVP